MSPWLLLLVLLAACAGPSPSASPTAAEPRVICQDLNADECRAAVAAAVPPIDGRVDLVVAQGYRGCFPGAFCTLGHDPPPGGYPLSAVVAIRFADGSRPVMFTVDDVMASSPVPWPLANDPALLLRFFDSPRPSASP